MIVSPLHPLPWNWKQTEKNQKHFPWLFREELTTAPPLPLFSFFFLFPASTQAEEIPFGMATFGPRRLFVTKKVMKPICLRCPPDCAPHSHQRAASEAMRWGLWSGLRGWLLAGPGAEVITHTHSLSLRLHALASTLLLIEFQKKQHVYVLFQKFQSKVLLLCVQERGGGGGEEGYACVQVQVVHLWRPHIRCQYMRACVCLRVLKASVHEWIISEWLAQRMMLDGG